MSLAKSRLPKSLLQERAMVPAERYTPSVFHVALDKAIAAG